MTGSGAARGSFRALTEVRAQARRNAGVNPRAQVDAPVESVGGRDLIATFDWRVRADWERERWRRLRSRYVDNFVFIHINKTGGSSVEHCLKLPLEHATVREKMQELGAETFRRRFSFAIVRNPWDKVVSHYHFRVKTNQTGLGDGSIGFAEWLVRCYEQRDPVLYDQPKMFMPQRAWLEDEQGQVAVDFVGRFERLAEDFAQICAWLGRSNLSLPKLKSSDRRDYAGYYTPELRDLVAKHFADDIEEFDYGFDVGSR